MNKDELITLILAVESLHVTYSYDCGTCCTTHYSCDTCGDNLLDDGHVVEMIIKAIEERF